MANQWSQGRFRVLLVITALTGMTQGLLIPLLTTLLEQRGVSSSINGLNAASLYVGMLLTAPLVGTVVRRLGYKRAILNGLLATACCAFLFPLFDGPPVWSVLLFLVGVGDYLLHFSTQLWVTSTSPAESRGRHITLYGFAFGAGFGLGPLGINLLAWGLWVPFSLMGACLLTAVLLSSLLDHGKLPADEGKEKARIGGKWADIYRWALVALCPAFLYGFLDASLAASFPVYGHREGLGTGWISVLLSAFVCGGLIMQMPLGMLSDRYGRKNVLVTICLLGGLGMAAVPFFTGQPVILLVLFSLIGGLLGSLYSLGLAYLADILPSTHLPEANAIAGAHFSVGSMVGPYVGGLLIHHIGGGSLFYAIATAFFTFVLLAFVYPVSVGADRRTGKAA
ncbi:MFS transporter [Planifilum fimeticola]